MKGRCVIKVHPGEKELYRIFKDLEKHGRTTFSYPDYNKQQNIAKSIGMRGKPLFESGLFIPPARTRQHRINVVALPIGVKVEERNVGRFYFHRKK